MGILNGTTLMMAGLAVLTAAATTVGVVTLVKNIQQEKKLQEVKNGLVTIENNNQHAVEGLTKKFNAQSAEQKEATNKNNPKLISAENEVADAEKYLANVKKAMKYIDALQRICDTIKVCGAQGDPVNVDKDVFKGLVGPNAVAGGAGAGFENETAIVKRMIADAPSITGKMDMVASTAGAVWEKLHYADNNAAFPHAGANPEKADNLMAGVRMAFQNELDDAEKAVADANKKVAKIKAALN